MWGRNLNLANLGGFLRLRLSLKQAIAEDQDDYDDQCRPWRHSLSMAFNWLSCLKITLLFFLIAATATAFLTLPVEQTLKDFLLWVKQDLGPWGPLVLGVAYIPLTVLAVPASILTVLQWMSQSHPGFQTWNEDLKPQQQARRASNKSGIDIEEIHTLKPGSSK